MTKAEKRHFKLYASRNTPSKESVAVQLFDVLDKMQEYNEQRLSEAFPNVKGNTLSNHKANLYEQLLSSLRLLHHHRAELRIKELVSYSDILRQKGMYRESLAQLAKAKIIAKEHGFDLQLLVIVEQEKKIESRYITRSHAERAKEILEQSVALRKHFDRMARWSDLSLTMYDHYLKYGHVRNEDHFQRLSSGFREATMGLEENPGSVYYYLSHYWYHFINMDFVQCFKHAKSYANQLVKHPGKLENEP